jgi:hypothetical protein
MELAVLQNYRSFPRLSVSICIKCMLIPPHPDIFNATISDLQGFFFQGGSRISKQNCISLNKFKQSTCVDKCWFLQQTLLRLFYK